MLSELIAKIQPAIHRKTLLVFLLVPSLTIFSLIVIPTLFAKLTQKSKTSPTATQPTYYHTEFDCGNKASCYVIRGDDREIDLEDVSGLNYPLDRGWKLAMSAKIDIPTIHYAIWHPDYLEFHDEDSGGIHLKKNGADAILIDYIMPRSDFKNKDLETIFFELNHGDFDDLENNQHFDAEKNIKFQYLRFTNGNHYILAKYPHYLTHVLDKDEPMSKKELGEEMPRNDRYEPLYSSYNKINYYIGEINDGTIVVVYDYQQISSAETMAFLQRLKIHFSQ